MRYVQIISNILTQPRGTIVAQDRLGMSDDKLDEFIAAGFAIECEIEEVAEAPAKPKRTRKAKS